MSDYKVIAIDFDKTIHDADNPIEGRSMGGPMEGAKEAIKKLSHNYRIVIHTVRGDSEHVHDWFKFYKIRYDEITNIKPKADYYLDDKGLKFTNWEQALKDIK